MDSGGIPLSDRARLAHLVKSTNQGAVLLRLAKSHCWETGAEIGVLKGKTLFTLLEGLPFLRMWAVDQWKVLPLREAENAETYHDFDMAECERQVRARVEDRYFYRCSILKGDSVDMAARVQDATLDFVFIDGDHTEVGCRSDITAWAPKIKPGGWLLGHDHHWTTVRAAIDALCPGWFDLGEAVWGLPVEKVRL